MRRRVPLAAAGLLACLSLAAGPGPQAEADLTAFWMESLSAPSTTGSEHLLARLVVSALPAAFEAAPDTFGTVTVGAGIEPPVLAIVTALDDHGWIVSGIEPDGRLRLDRPVAPPHPRFDAWLLGRPVVISTREGLVQGVVAQPAMHLLTRERRQAQVEEFDLEDAYVDIHAASEAEVLERGVARLDAVTIRPRRYRLAENRFSGPSLGQKGCIAALALAAAGGLPADGGTALVFAAQTKALVRGRGARRSLGVVRSMNSLRPKTVIVLETIDAPASAPGGARDGGPSPRLGGGPVLLGAAGSEPSPLQRTVEQAARDSGIALQYAEGAESPMLNAAAAAGTEALGLALPVRYLHTPAEIAAAADAEALQKLLQRLISGGAR